jgi:hypothetical protein
MTAIYHYILPAPGYEPITGPIAPTHLHPNRPMSDSTSTMQKESNSSNIRQPSALDYGPASVNDLSRSNGSDFPMVDFEIWRDFTISGVLRHTTKFGGTWWYRVQPADDIFECDIFDNTEAFGKPLKEHAKSWFPLPRACCYVIWAPQWVPAGSITVELEKAFWRGMPRRFWDLTMYLNEDMIWREEMEQCISLSRNTSQHLCTREDCRVCRAI